MSRRRLLGLPAAPAERRLVAALSGTTMLLWVGASAILPLLPSYLRQKGSSTGLVGLIMSAYFAASVVSQYPVGRLSDRLGRRPVVLVGLAVFAAGSVGFALVGAPLWALAFRGLQGVGAGAVTVASAAAIGTLVAAGERGGAFGALYGSQMLALALGPLVGSILGASSMRLLFAVAALAALAASMPVVAVLPAGRGTLLPSQSQSPSQSPSPSAGTAGVPGIPLASLAEAAVGSGGAPAGEGVRTRTAAEGRRPGAGPGVAGGASAMLGVLAVFASAGLFGGMYETCWTLLLRLRHAADFEIGLSWTLFALPYALLSIPAGRLAERADRRLLAVGSVLWAAGFCAAYPLLHDVGLLVGLGCLEAVGTVVGAPPALLVLSEHVPPERQGGAQGAVETARTAAMAGAAAASGALFGVAPLIPFEMAAVLGAVAAAVVTLAWRGLAPGGGGVTAGSGSLQAASLLAAERGSAAPESPPRGGYGAGAPGESGRR